MSYLKRPIFLDSQSTTPLDPKVFELMQPYFIEKFGNPHSHHKYGLENQAAINIARQQVADSINADPEEIIFCSGATEANNFAITSLTEILDKHKKIITLETEHKCIIESASYAADCGIEVVKLKVNADGVLDLKNLDAELKIKPAIVSIMAVNNETGVIQDMASIGELCERYYSYLHTDAAQAIGRIPLDVKEMNIMAMSISGHKFYGPKGIGIFFIDRTIKNLIKPLIRGGGQEFRLRSGTLPTPLCVGIGHAIELAVKNIQSDQATCSKLNNLFLNKLKDSNPEIKINGSINKRIKDNLNIRIPGIYSEQLIANVPEVAFSTGSACTSGQIETSHVLRAMGLDDKQARESFRISFNKMLSEKQAFDAADFIIRGCSKLRNI
tara:strand:- start:419 stop:1570 length:1152 start_codon:yes stop_codon:yes gene_type:complete